jgi:Domain of unknown function (DU1801)
MVLSALTESRSLVHLYQKMPENERIILDMLRQIVIETLPAYCKEKLSFNVPLFYGNRAICIIWPATVPRGGIKEGVLLGFWHGNKLNDSDSYLTHGTNKQIFYKVYKSPEQIRDKPLKKLLKEAVKLDQSFKRK